MKFALKPATAALAAALAAGCATTSEPPAPLQEALLQHAADHVRQCRAVDACALDELGLAQPLLPGDCLENYELPRSKAAC